jgi:hypothetical protein
MEIVPAFDVLVAEAQIAPANADDERVGQAAQLQFTRLLERGMPTLLATGLSISPDAIRDERTDAADFALCLRTTSSELDNVRGVRGAAFDVQAGASGGPHHTAAQAHCARLPRLPDQPLA